YLLNYTSTGKPQIVDNVYVGIYALYPNGTIVPVEYKQIQYNTPMTFTFSATGAPVYLYGIVYPVFNVYNVAGMSGMLTGEDKGMVMSLWGAILVEG
ncbi:MAG: oxidase, partial [Thermoprotei archaeon]